jgi:enediyne polyketide synthase
VVAGQGRLTCDVESVTQRSTKDWTGLLGKELLAVRDQLASTVGESSDIAGTRTWVALECVRKTGALKQALTVDQVHPDGWVVLSAGSAKVATWVTTLTGRDEPVVFGVLVGKEG